ncbi:DoxX family protein [Erwinia sorbitola]|uniref:DoxX family membrane protein n=1 Tax=Erwinia sorbitola TaxID=2681984 RepID=A0A6I6ENR3_9GAMM|nr:DoxX family protein [Erwinia sorbitola]MTD27546.1 DoxX family membrane protein [Erwinia sorbitola]QGU89765.1 DoxX family membrane protein [Erwinia sorbitola]
MKKLEDTGFVVARLMMVILFIVAGYGKLTNYAGTQEFMASMGIPSIFVPLTVLLEFGGGLAILFGFFTRTTALITAIFTVLTAILAHSNFAVDGSTMFLKNISIAGGFLLLAITGPGAYSIDRLLGKKW